MSVFAVVLLVSNVCKVSDHAASATSSAGPNGCLEGVAFPAWWSLFWIDYLSPWFSLFKLRINVNMIITASLKHMKIISE